MHSDHRSGCRQPVGNASRPERSSKKCGNFNLLFNQPLVRKTGPHDGTDETKFHCQSEKLLQLALQVKPIQLGKSCFGFDHRYTESLLRQKDVVVILE